MTPPEAGVLLAAGLAAGFINTLAGGGSVITLPALEFATGSPLVANATNRIAILLQNVAGVATFHKGKALDVRLGVRLTVPAVVGGVAGAWVASILDAGSMRVALSLAVLFVALTALVRPPKTPPLETPLAKTAAFLLVGFYAGFVQAGVGFLLLACLVGGLGLDLVKANAVKVFIVLFAAVPALVVFGLQGQLWLAHGLVLAAGNMTGAWLAARMAIKRGAAWVRVVVVVAALLAIVKLLVFQSGPR